MRHFVERKSRELQTGCFPSPSPGRHRPAVGLLLAGECAGIGKRGANGSLISEQRGSAYRFEGLHGGKSDDRSAPPSDPRDQSINLDAVVSSHIRRVLEITRGKVHGKGGAAELLGINPSTLRNRMNQLRIPYGKKSARKEAGEHS